MTRENEFRGVRQFCASDKEIFDLLMSSKRKISIDSLRQIARERGIIYSLDEPRCSLAKMISVLPHDLLKVTKLIEMTEVNSRNDKTTSIRIAETISIDEIVDALKEYKSEGIENENINFISSNSRVSVTMEYTEIDYSKTRLIQRRDREAEIDIITEGNTTTIRLPANEKSDEVVTAIINKIERNKKAELPKQKIDLSGVPSSEKRTSFFTALIVMDGFPFRFDSVVRVRVQKGKEDEISEDSGPESPSLEESAARAFIESAALHGKNVQVSEEFQKLQKKGFYISSVTWRSVQSETPFNLVEFEASFDDPHECTVFKYVVKAVYQKVKESFQKTSRKPTDTEKEKMLKALEASAHAALEKIQASE